MQDKGYHALPVSRNSPILAITGNAVRIQVWNHALSIEDGFKAEGEVRRRYVHRAVAQPDRVLLLATSGFATLSSLDWCGENNIPVVCCDQAGHLRWTLLPGDGGQWRSTLRRAQALAAFNDIGREIVRWILAEKVRQQQTLLRRLATQIADQHAEWRLDQGEVSRAAAALEKTLTRIETTALPIERLRFLESQAAEVYWSGWAGIAPRFAPPSYARTVPDHWRIFSGRHSPISGGPKDAINPLNCLLNFGYSLLMAEATIAAHASGLDPTLGLLHSDRDARLNFVLDLMEPARPAVDRCVLDLVSTHTFRRGELWDLRDGTCRLDQEFAAYLCGEWMPRFRREITPVLEKVASWLRHARIAHQDHPAHKALPKKTTGTCPECGSPVRPGRRFCSQACYAVWWKAHVQRRIAREGNETLARFRAEGKDPSHGGEAGRKRAAAVSRAKRWEWMTLTPEERRRRTRPATLARWSTGAESRIKDTNHT